MRLIRLNQNPSTATKMESVITKTFLLYFIVNRIGTFHCFLKCDWFDTHPGNFPWKRADQSNCTAYETKMS